MAMPAGVCAILAVCLLAEQEPTLSDEQMRNFLLTAEVIRSEQVKRGVTGIYRLTLSNGTIVHDAAFQSIDLYKEMMQFADGKTDSSSRSRFEHVVCRRTSRKMAPLPAGPPVHSSPGRGDRPHSLWPHDAEVAHLGTAVYNVAWFYRRPVK